MRDIRRAGLSTVTLLALACGTAVGPESPVGFEHAAGTAACGPADGAAVAIYLAADTITAIEPPAPFVRVYLWQPLDQLAGRSWVLVDPSTAGSAQYCSAVSSCEPTSAGEVTIRSVGADSVIGGTVDLTFPVAGHIAGGFRAVWLSRTILCG
jgi:hypothetical protein